METESMSYKNVLNTMLSILSIRTCVQHDCGCFVVNWINVGFSDFLLKIIYHKLVHKPHLFAEILGSKS